MSDKNYFSLPYTIDIIPDEEDGGYIARVRELWGCVTQADSWNELHDMIEDAKAPGWKVPLSTATRFQNRWANLGEIDREVSHGNVYDQNPYRQ